MPRVATPRRARSPLPNLFIGTPSTPPRSIPRSHLGASLPMLPTTVATSPTAESGPIPAWQRPKQAAASTTLRLLRSRRIISVGLPREGSGFDSMRNGIDIQPRHAGALLVCTLADSVQKVLQIGVNANS
jgi:hypothetical protein